MLSSCGVIVEYNPFHNGHKYHIEQARKKSGSDVIVAVMSGNFLQRGEPAIIDKWQRAEVALQNGADVVIELPFIHSVQSADYFAKGAVDLLHSLKVSNLCFGTDNVTDIDYQKFAEFNQENAKEIKDAFQSYQGMGLSYPQQMTKVYQKLYPEWPLEDNSPNHILGMSYAKANQSHLTPMILHPIKRQGAGYHDTQIEQHSFASATGIRKKIMLEEYVTIQNTLPVEMLSLLKTSEPIDWEKAWPLLKYQLVKLSVEELSNIYQMSEGIEFRIKEMGLKANSFEEFVATVKNKRFTWTRLQRLAIYILLGITSAELESARETPYIRMLGFTKTGQMFLNQQKQSIDIPLITNINKKNEQLLNLDIKAGQIYQLLGKKIPSQDYQRKPIVF